MSDVNQYKSSSTEFLNANVLPRTEVQSPSSDLDEISSVSRSVPNSSKKCYLANRLRRKSRSQSLYDGSGKDEAYNDIVVRHSAENLVNNDRFPTLNEMTFPRPIASINVSRVASASSNITETVIDTTEQPPHDIHARLRPSIITLFGRIVSRNNSNTDDADDTGIRARILRAFSYVGKNFRIVFFYKFFNVNLILKWRVDTQRLSL